MDDPDYIVIRRAPNLPAEFDTGDLEGKWFDRRDMLSDVGVWRAAFTGAVGVATGRFEVRESDGAVAEVFELRV